MNRIELKKKLNYIISKHLKEKGYISLIDVFVSLGYLSESDVEAWRMKRIPYLEKCIMVNLSKISFISKTVRLHCKNSKLKESYTVYRSWGKRKKINLRFSKSGHPTIEKAYSTHFIQQKKLDKENTMSG